MTKEKDLVKQRNKRFLPPTQKRSLIWLALSFSTVSFFLIVAIRPTIITIVKLNKEIKEKEAASLLLDKKIDSLVQAQEIFALSSQKIPLLDQALPAKSEFPLIFDLLNRVATTFQIELDSVSFEKVVLTAPLSVNKNKNTTPYQTILFSVTAKGEYLNLKNFITSLENSRRIINLQSTQISETKKKNSETSEPVETVLHLTISGTAFFEKE